MSRPPYAIQPLQRVNECRCYAKGLPRKLVGMQRTRPDDVAGMQNPQCRRYERNTARSGCATRPGFLTTACSSARSCSAGRGALRLLCAGGILGKYRAVAARGAVVSHIPTKFSGSTAGLDALRYSPGENCRLVGCGRGALSEGLGIYHRQIARGQHPRRMLTKAPRATPASAPPRRAGTAGQPRH